MHWPSECDAMAMVMVWLDFAGGQAAKFRDDVTVIDGS